MSAAQALRAPPPGTCQVPSRQVRQPRTATCARLFPTCKAGTPRASSECVLRRRGSARVSNAPRSRLSFLWLFPSFPLSHRLCSRPRLETTFWSVSVAGSQPSFTFAAVAGLVGTWPPRRCFTFRRFSCPRTVTPPKDRMENSRNKQFFSCKLHAGLHGVMKFCPVPPCPTQDVTLPSAQRPHAVDAPCLLVT